MGFGSYDESEQENQRVDEDEDAGESVSVEENAHEGEVSFETEGSTEDLIDRLQHIKDDAED